MRELKIAFTYGLITTTVAIGSLAYGAQAFANDKTKDGPAFGAGDQVKHFRQLGPESLPTPNIFRNAAGAPGPAYWQQQANVNIDAALDEDEKRITASMEIDYVNNSPDTLNYIWLALDQNRFKDGSLARESTVASAAGSRRIDENRTPASFPPRFVTLSAARFGIVCRSGFSKWIDPERRCFYRATRFTGGYEMTKSRSIRLRPID